MIDVKNEIKNTQAISRIHAKKLPNRIIDADVITERKHYLCPHCLKDYSARVVASISYDKPVNRSLEGVAFRTGYFCGDCGDYAFEVDEKILETVRACLNAGIHTISSCSGHVAKSDQFDFMYEGDIIYIDDNYKTCGAILAIAPFDKDDEKDKREIFEETVQIAKGWKDYGNKVIINTPDEDSRNYFFIAPVSDVKAFRKAGSVRREIMVNTANQNLYKFMERFISFYIKTLKALSEFR